MSLAFRVTDDSWNEELDARLIRSYSIHRGDVSVVNYGANPATSVSVRSADAINGVIGALEQRAGKMLPVDTAAVMARALTFAATDDDTSPDAVLAELRALPAPDDVPPAEPEPEPLLWALPEYTTREHERLLILQNGRRR